MSSDESGVIVNSWRDPKYRADCMDYFYDPKQDGKIDFKIPKHVRVALEAAAERADRTFNDQLLYVLRVCRGAVDPDFDDERSVFEWRDLIGQMHMQFHAGEAWMPCSVIFPSAW